MRQKLPIYRQISEYLHRGITAGRWLPGDRLPIEAELAANLGVAVGTLRKALAQLEKDGLLERRQGSGTYVKRAPDTKAIYDFFHLEMLSALGSVPTATTLSLDPCANSDLPEVLSAWDEAWCVRRHRFLNQSLVAVEEIYFNKQHAKKLDVEELHESLYLFYETQFKFWISRVEDQIDCQIGPDWVCDALGLARGSVLPRVRRCSWSSEDQLEEFSYTWFDPAKVNYVARWR